MGISVAHPQIELEFGNIGDDLSQGTLCDAYHKEHASHWRTTLDTPTLLYRNNLRKRVFFFIIPVSSASLINPLGPFSPVITGTLGGRR